MKSITTANSTFALGGVSYSANSFVIAENSVLRINICIENPAHQNMKILLLMSSIILFSFSELKENPSDFEYKLSGIVHNFKQEIMDKEKCEKHKREASDLVDDIKDAIKMEDKYTLDELVKLKELKKETEALEEYIASVGDCGNYIPSIEDFNLANRRVGGRVVSIIKDKFCVDIIAVNIGKYVAYIGENNTIKNYIVTYKWKASNGMNTGSGTMGLSKKSVRHIYDNREKPNQNKISVFGITCKEF